jgi:lipoprotein-releasing system ATP-binding protein
LKKRKKMLLQLDNIFKGYGIPGSHSFRQVLTNLTWEVEKGSGTGITGPSGSGKSTLLNISGALDRPDSGHVIFNNQDISQFTDDQLALFRNRELGFVFQQHFLFPQYTLLENVLLPVLPYQKRITASDRNWAEYLLRKTGIWDQRNQKPGEMSGGECQRTAVVRAIINKPGLLLADEPSGALDEQNASNLADLLLSLSHDEGITLVIVTHSAELASKMDKVYVLHDGNLILRP